MVRIHQHAKFQATPLRSQENAWNPQIWPILLSQNYAKIRKINRLWLKSHQSWRWSGYMCILNLRPFVHEFCRKCLEIQKFPVCPTWVSASTIAAQSPPIICNAPTRNRQRRWEIYPIHWSTATKDNVATSPEKITIFNQLHIVSHS